MVSFSTRERKNSEREKREKNTHGNSRQTQVGLSRQLTLDIAAWLGMSLELSLEGLHLFLGQPRSRQVLGVFFVVHDGLVVEVHHIERWRRRMGVHVAIHGMHHGRVRHGRVEGHGLFHGDRRMACKGVRMVQVIHVGDRVSSSFRKSRKSRFSWGYIDKIGN